MDEGRPGDVVVLRALGLGDLLTAVPALRGVQRALAGHRLILAGPAVLSPLLSLAGLDYTIRDTPGLDAPARLPRRVEVAVNLHGRGPESHLLLLGTTPRRLFAFRHRNVPADGPTWDREEHERQRWCRMLGHFGIAADPDDYLITTPAPAPALRGVTVIHPGASAPARRWPWRRWAQVARAELAAGRRVVLTGSGGERPDALRLAEAAGLPADEVFAGRTDIAALAAIVAAADMVMSADTGVAHLATALGRPRVILFGPMPPSSWGPPQTASTGCCGRAAVVTRRERIRIPDSSRSHLERYSRRPPHFEPASTGFSPGPSCPRPSSPGDRAASPRPSSRS